MAEKKRKVNAKVFLNDLRTGMNREELLAMHGLNEKSLDKLVGMLVEREMLDPAELDSLPALTRHREEDMEPSEGTGSEAAFSGVPGEIPGSVILSQCPQCGAKVGERTLICPECGHVLPGQERWEEVEPKKSLTERIPPLLWGVILAIPVAVLLFFFFKDFMLPATEAKIDKRIRAIRNETPKGKTPMQAAKDAGVLIKLIYSPQSISDELLRTCDEVKMLQRKMLEKHSLEGKRKTV